MANLLYKGDKLIGGASISEGGSDIDESKVQEIVDKSLTDYYPKTETYSQSEVDDLLNNFADVVQVAYSFADDTLVSQARSAGLFLNGDIVMSLPSNKLYIYDGSSFTERYPSPTELYLVKTHYEDDISQSSVGSLYAYFESNSVGFVKLNNEDVDLSNYYPKDEVYTKDETLERIIGYGVGEIKSYTSDVPDGYVAMDGSLLNVGEYPQFEAWMVQRYGYLNYFGGDGASTYVVEDLSNTRQIDSDMTSNSAPSPRAVSASSVQRTAAAAWHAFSGESDSGDTDTQIWLSADNSSNSAVHWIQMDFGRIETINRVTVRNRNSATWYNAQAPNCITFYGSNDGITWTAIKTFTDMDDWTQFETRTFDFDDAVSYRYIQLGDMKANAPTTSVGATAYRICLTYISFWYVPSGNKAIRIKGSNGHTYSTEEQAVGTDYDGKTIYEKTIIGKTPSASGEVSTDLNGVASEIVEYSVMVKTTNGYYANITYYSSGTTTLANALINSATMGIYFTLNSDSYKNADFRATIKYKKA